MACAELTAQDKFCCGKVMTILKQVATLALCQGNAADPKVASRRTQKAGPCNLLYLGYNHAQAGYNTCLVRE